MRRNKIGWVALAAVGLLGACSDPADPGGENMGSSAGSAGSPTAGGAGKAGGGGSGTSGSSSTAGKPSTAGSGGGAVAGSGGAGTAGRSVGGQGGSGELAGSGGDVGEGGAGGTVSTNCEVESLHVKVSGGVTFERTNAVDDYCGGSIGGENNGLGVAFFLNPPQVENTLLASADAYQVAPGTTGTFKAEQLSILATGAIWDMHLPDAENPLPCSMKVTKYEKVDDVKWRIAGSLSCSAALSGIGMLGGTPLKIEDFTYSIVIDTTPAQ